MGPPLLKTWIVTCQGFDGHEWTVSAPTAGNAKYRKWLDITESYPDVQITAMRARRMVTEPVEPPGFRRVVESRGIGFARIGMKVQLDGGEFGRIVGHNDSANLDVLVGGAVCNVHPLYRVTYFDDAGQVIPLPPHAEAAPSRSAA